MQLCRVFLDRYRKGGYEMFVVNIKATGIVGIHRYTDRGRLKYFKKEELQREIEKIQFEDKEKQKEIEKFSEKLPILKVIGLGEDGKVDLYIEFARFGSKKPEYVILENYTLSNKIKHFMENHNHL